MMLRAALVLLLLLARPPGAEENPLSGVLGSYQGPVLNAGQIQQLATDFEFDAGGKLVGHYLVEDNPPFEGDLTDFVPDGPTSGTFTWRDRFGHGVVHIRFEPDRDRFLGAWGDDMPLADHIFDGYRIRPPGIS